MARPRKPRPRWPALPKRAYGSGSLSRDPASGEIRARLPKRISPTRQSRLFPADQAVEAGAWLDAALVPDSVAAEALTLGDWSGYWHQTYVEPLHPPNTARWYLYALRKLAALDGTLLADLRASQIQATAGQLAQTIDPATLKGIVAVWRRCLESAVDDELIARNPARQVKVPKQQATASQERRHITPAEVAKLWPAIRGHRFEAAYALMLGCGLRIGEILGLHWEHVNLLSGRAWIQHQFTNGHWRPLPKGRNPHAVRLPSSVVAALRRHRATQPADTTLVMQSQFPRPQRKNLSGGPRPWSRTVVVAELAKLLTALEIGHATFHASRHGLASYWLDGGVPASVVAERLGHSNAGVTLKFYARTSTEGHALADELSDELLSETPDEGVSGAESA
jgi:integrase